MRYLARKLQWTFDFCQIVGLFFRLPSFYGTLWYNVEGLELKVRKSWLLTKSTFTKWNVDCI